MVNFCKGCDRYLQPPAAWIQADLESRELLTILIKKLKPTLVNVRLTDASFVWTEPHSKRIKIKITVQKEIQEGAILEQVIPVSRRLVDKKKTQAIFYTTILRSNLSFKVFNVPIAKERPPPISGKVLFR